MKRPRRLIPWSESARASIPAELRESDREWLGFVPVLRAGALGPFTLVCWGTRARVGVDPAELFLRVLALRPEAFFLFHPHPSGTLSPSPEDLDLTRRVGAVARALGIPLLGHGIVSGDRIRWVPSETAPLLPAPTEAELAKPRPRVS